MLTFIVHVATDDLGDFAGFRDPPPPLRAGVAKIDITNPRAPRVSDPCYAKALVLSQGEMTAVVVTVDAVAIGGIGAIRDTFLDSLRQELAKDPGIPADHVVVNASHCHGNVRGDAGRLAVQAVREAWKGLTRVKVGTGVVTETRISENRRVTLKNGSQVDMRRAYSLAWDKEIASVGPIDPQVGLVRIDREDGRPLAVLYNFACHPIMNPPSKGSSADFPGYASALIEKTIARRLGLFRARLWRRHQPGARDKEVNRPPDAEPLGNLLGARVLEGIQGISVAPTGKLSVKRQVISLPRAADYQRRIDALEAERNQLVSCLKGTNINFKSFLPLFIQQRLDPEFPSAHAQGYLHDRSLKRDDLMRLDADNRADVEAYLGNIRIMEELTRLNTNLALLKMHQANNKVSEGRGSTWRFMACHRRLQTGDVPGRATAEIGLNIKRSASDPGVFVAGYTNGYIYYTPTAQQRANTGYAQEDCDCMVAPEWQKIFETGAGNVARVVAESSCAPRRACLKLGLTLRHENNGRPREARLADIQD